MTAISRINGNGDRIPPVAETFLDPGFGAVSIRERFGAAVDTVIVLAMQVTFRASMFLRHMNY